jgi:hypothetical protein
MTVRRREGGEMTTTTMNDDSASRSDGTAGPRNDGAFETCAAVTIRSAVAGSYTRRPCIFRTTATTTTTTREAMEEE